jgi:uncharacterized protein YyaL (SSP411 family)
MATRAFSEIRVRLRSGSDRLWSTYQAGQGKYAGYLDDYAYLAMAALDLSRFATDPAPYLRDAEAWSHAILRHFQDPAQAGFFFTADDHEKLIQRPKTLFDQAIPAGTAVALEVFLALSELGYGAELGAEAERQLKGLYPLFEKSTLGFGESLNLALLWKTGPVTISGPNAAKSCIHPHFFQKPMESAAPSAGAGGLLVCHRQSCSLPIADAGKAAHEAWLKLKL